MDFGQGLGCVFDGTYEGLLTIIYEHFYKKMNFLSIEHEDYAQQKIGMEYIYIKTDTEKALKVYNSIPKKISSLSADTAYYAFLHNDSERFIYIYLYILLGFKTGKTLDNHKNVDFVLKTQNFAKAVRNEAHFNREFIRFTETQNGIYYADISPKYDVLVYLSEHFADRFPSHPWIIHDVSRNIAAIYNGEHYVFTETPKDAVIQYSDNEKEYQQLWKRFFETIAIKERASYKLQRGNLPLRFRKHMTEFKLN